jgi:hypothetical protein
MTDLEQIEVTHPVFKKASTLEEIATFAGTDARFIRREIAKGNLKARKFNSRMIRILPLDLIAWLKRAETNREVEA